MVEMVNYRVAESGRRYVRCGLCGEYEFFEVLEAAARWTVNHYECWHPDRVDELRQKNLMRSRLASDEYFVPLMERMVAGARQDGFGLSPVACEVIELRGKSSQRVRFTACGHEATVLRTLKVPTCAKCRR
jgi:hypothetical protein